MAIRIIVFDMDGVLVDINSSWSFVHKKLGKSNAESLKQYINGRIEYHELLRRDIALWGEIHVDVIKGILSEAPLMRGATRTIEELKRKGYRTAIISAGLAILAERLQTLLGIDYAFANSISVDKKGMVTGTTNGAVELLNKAHTLKRLADIEKTSLHSCAVIGDSVFDIPLFRAAGMSMAFNTSDSRVIEAADFVVKEKDLTGILQYL